MANFRMISKSTVSSDRFLDLPPAAQLLYFHVAISADDDGFTDNLNMIRRMLGAKKEDVSALVSAGFLYVFESGVAVDMFWNVNNSIRKDRYKPTAYQDEFKMLDLVAGGRYVLKPTGNQPSTNCQQNGNQVTTVCQPSDNQATTNRKQNGNQVATNCQQKPNDNQMSTKCQPNGDKVQPTCGVQVAQVRLGKDKLNNNPSIQQSKSSYSSANNNNISVYSARAREGEKPVAVSVCGDNAEQTTVVSRPASLDGMDFYNLSDSDACHVYREVYPRHQGSMVDIQTAWVLAIAGGAKAGDIVMAAKKYAAECREKKTDPQYIKMPQNFISSGAWKQYVPKYLPSCPHCHGQGIYEDGGRMIMCDCDRRYGP